MVAACRLLCTTKMAKVQLRPMTHGNIMMNTSTPRMNCSTKPMPNEIAANRKIGLSGIQLLLPYQGLAIASASCVSVNA